MWAQLFNIKGKLVRKCIYFKIEFCKLGNLKRKLTLKQLENILQGEAVAERLNFKKPDYIIKNGEKPDCRNNFTRYKSKPNLN